MTRDALERRQLWIYLAAIVAGLALGRAAPPLAGPAEAALWPALAALLFATFTQVPLADLRLAMADRRFMWATMIGNFLAVPLLVAALLPLMPADPAIRLGAAMVLLVPCTDWFITFTHLAGGDARRAVAVTPVNLLLQLALLPVYLWLMLGSGLTVWPPLGSAATAFALLIAAPLALAWRLEVRARADLRLRRLIAGLGAAPVPLLAVVVFLIAVAQAQAVVDAWATLAPVALVFAVFALLAALLAAVASGALALPVEQGVTLIFGLVTRNSFVVLPLALALPDAWAQAAVVIVLQSLVELAAILALVPLARRMAGAR
jgi:ACR3 family arsenite efflux pump ArsB